MKRLFMLLILQIIILGSTFTYADEPAISYNVTVMQNATASQCPTEFRSDSSPADVIDYTRFGEADDMTSPGVRSCTGCSIIQSNCVCKTCYEYFN